MFNTRFGHTLAAAFCTVLMSSACVLSAVGPAQADGGKVVAAIAARPTA